MFRSIFIFFVVSVIHEAYAAQSCENKTIGYEDKGTSKKVDKNPAGYGVLMMAEKFKFTCCGSVSTFKVRVGGKGTVVFQVWRRTDQKNEHKLMGQYETSFDKAGVNEVLLPTNQRISVSPGDYIGWQSKSKGVIIYDEGKGTSNNNYIMNKIPAVSYGSIVNWGPAKKVNKRSYAVQAIGVKNFPPTVRNLPEKIVIPKTQKLGDLFNVEVTDNDKLDIHDMTVELQGNSEYFAVKPGTSMIILKKEPKVWNHKLRVVVKDHCDKTEPLELTVTVTDPGTEPKPTDSPATVARATDTEEFVWDWLVAALVAVAIVVVVAVLLLVFHKKGWLHKAHRTHPPRKDIKDAEKANGNKIDDISKTEPKKDGFSKQDGVTNKDAQQNDVKPKDIKQDGSQPKDIKQDGTKTKYVKPK